MFNIKRPLFYAILLHIIMLVLLTFNRPQPIIRPQDIDHAFMINQFLLPQPSTHLTSTHPLKSKNKKTHDPITQKNHPKHHQQPSSQRHKTQPSTHHKHLVHHHHEATKHQLSTTHQSSSQQKTQKHWQNVKTDQKIINHYIPLIINAISQHWVVPFGIHQNISCQLLIHLSPSGHVLDVKVTKSSGNTILDRSAVNAVIQASPLPIPSGNAFHNFQTLALTVTPTSNNQ